MLFSEWEPVYLEILSDMGYERADDESSARLLKALTVNSDLVTEDVLESIGPVVTVFGAADSLASSLEASEPEGTLISAGAATSAVMSAGILPDMLVTDLDGDVTSQIDASRSGALTIVHAHGDNSDLIREHIGSFTGPLILTTQSVPDMVMRNFGGFTDGDRAVCIARHFGARRIDLMGFDFLQPSTKDGSDPEVKRRKLRWAERITVGMNPPGVELRFL